MKNRKKNSKMLYISSENRKQANIYQHLPTYFMSANSIYHVETFSKLGIEGNFVNLIRRHYKNPTVNIILTVERLNGFLL